ncbi:Gfo/Idh/MocA family protein [Streptomyces sp. NPDC058964]|uniref:Gfo/Idh/MocA family protein n=1 Tax=Streptomyces sp. NPDC058964 TaxID=3346681 RepID=UPI0036768F8C
MPPVSLIVVGAGDRGAKHAKWALAHPDRAHVVGVAEPREVHRTRFARDHALPPERTTSDWRDLAALGKIADAVLICTPDRLHVEPAVTFAALGYHIMVEKPMALDEASCREIVKAVEQSGVMFSVGHVLRYTPYTRALKQLIDSGRLGTIVSIQRLEPVGFWHQAHSFVRGNWRRSDEATSMLMAKSCHDLDWLQYVLGEPPARVSSFGRLSHFHSANRPTGAADRCLDCSVAAECRYSASRFYGDLLDRQEHRWPLSVVVDSFTPEALEEALRTGPYGRCVYACDNDVVDHQVVAMEYPGGATATFTMTAFTEVVGKRSTRFFGTRGEMAGDGETIRVYDFLTRTEESIAVTGDGTMNAAGGHGGGDAGLMGAFIEAVATKDPTRIKSGPRDSLLSHISVLAAERARRNGSVETVRNPL